MPFAPKTTSVSPSSWSYARLGRGVGVISQGMWIVQMGFSFFSDIMVHGCSLQGKSRGNYTIKCKGHPEYHRGRAIATLQFNCHLAILATLHVVVYGIVSKKHGNRRDRLHYRPLEAEIQQLDGQSRFTLDSDDDENGIQEECGNAKGYCNSACVGGQWLWYSLKRYSLDVHFSWVKPSVKLSLKLFVN